MTKKGSGAGTTSKMTVLVFQLQGDDATLQAGLKTIATTLAGVVPTNSFQQIPQGQKPAAAALDSPQLDKGEAEVGDVVDVSAEPVTSSKPSKRSAPHKPPQVVEIDLKGSVPLEEFLAKCPSEDISVRYLMIAYWLKEYQNIEEISIDHIYTCYRHMRWSVPNDIVQPLRNLKSRKSWFSKGSLGCYKINHIGEAEAVRNLKGTT